MDWELRPTARKQGYVGGTYICMIDGLWHAFRNRWKADWHRRHGGCACITAPTLKELSSKIQLYKKRGYHGFDFNPASYRQGIHFP